MALLLFVALGSCKSQAALHEAVANAPEAPSELAWAVLVLLLCAAQLVLLLLMLHRVLDDVCKRMLDLLDWTCEQLADLRSREARQGVLQSSPSLSPVYGTGLHLSFCLCFSSGVVFRLKLPKARHQGGRRQTTVSFQQSSDQLSATFLSCAAFNAGNKAGAMREDVHEMSAHLSPVYTKR